LKNPFINKKIRKENACVFLTASCFLFLLIGCSANRESSIQKEYYKTGVLKSVESYKNEALYGISREYYETGKLKHAVHYEDNVINGMYNTYYPNTTIWIKDIYVQGTLISHNEYNEQGDIVKAENFKGN